MWEHLDEFLGWLRTRSGSNDAEPVGRLSARAYRSKLRQFRAWLAGRDVTIARLIEYREYLQFEAPGKEGHRGQRPRTIKAAFCPVGIFFDWLEEQKGVTGLPDPRRVKKPRVTRSDKGGFHQPDPEEVERVFQAAESLPDYTLAERFYRAQALAILALAADCGLRRKEILGKDLDDLHRDQEPWAVVTREGKGREYRRSLLPEGTPQRAHFQAYLRVLAEWQEQCPARKSNRAMFPVDRSRRWSRDTIHQLRHRLLHEAGLSDKRIRLHDFRGFRITELLGTKDVNPATVAEMMGHADVATTLGYAQPREKEQLRAVIASARGARPAEEKRKERRRPQRHAPGGARERR